MPGTPYLPRECTRDKCKVKRKEISSQNALKKQQHVEKGGEIGYIGNGPHEDREDTEKIQNIPSSSQVKQPQGGLHPHPIQTTAPTLLDQLERKKKRQRHEAKKRHTAPVIASDK